MSNQPLTVVVVSPDRKIHEQVASVLTGNADIESLWTLAEYPNTAALMDLRKAPGGCVVFLDFSDPMRAKAVAAELDASYPMATAVAVLSGSRPEDLIELMQLGIREVVTLPIAAADVIRAYTRVARKLRAPAAPDHEAGHLYAFLPSKPGVGATTIAAHTAAALARLSNQRTLLLDFDFRLGMTSFLFKLNGDHSVIDAIAAHSHLDSDLWDGMVCRRGMLDILGSAPVDFGGVNPEKGALELVDFACQSYRAICIDLPGEMRDYEIGVMHRATECFLVTTPDIGALHMAKRKAEALVALGIHNKVSVIMNQVGGRGAMSIRDVETILQLPVRFSVESEPKLIGEATQAGRTLEGKSTLLKQIEAIARHMSPGEASGEGAKPRRFIETFSVSPVRDRSKWGW
jgi:pilus assembly protein CpaE